MTFIKTLAKKNIFLHNQHFNHKAQHRTDIKLSSTWIPA